MVGPVGHLVEALHIAASEDFDAAVLDVNLGGQTVYPVAEVLGTRNVPFAFLTGYGDLRAGGPVTTRIAVDGATRPAPIIVAPAAPSPLSRRSAETRTRLWPQEEIWPAPVLLTTLPQSEPGWRNYTESADRRCLPAIPERMGGGLATLIPPMSVCADRTAGAGMTAGIGRGAGEAIARSERGCHPVRVRAHTRSMRARAGISGALSRLSACSAYKPAPPKSIAALP